MASGPAVAARNWPWTSVVLSRGLADRRASEMLRISGIKMSVQQTLQRPAPKYWGATSLSFQRSLSRRIHGRAYNSLFWQPDVLIIACEVVRRLHPILHP